MDMSLELSTFFFPQTFGLAFLFSLIISILFLQDSLLNNKGCKINRSILVSFMLAGLLYTYNDMAPFVGAVLIIYLSFLS